MAGEMGRQRSDNTKETDKSDKESSRTSGERKRFSPTPTEGSQRSPLEEQLHRLEERASSTKETKGKGKDIAIDDKGEQEKIREYAMNKVNGIEKIEKSIYTRFRDFMLLGKGKGNHRLDEINPMAKKIAEALNGNLGGVSLLPRDLQTEWLHAGKSLADEAIKAHEQAWICMGQASEADKLTQFLVS